jgi:hypothetical protein
VIRLGAKVLGGAPTGLLAVLLVATGIARLRGGSCTWPAPGVAP